MLNYYEVMARNNDSDVDGTAIQEDNVRNAIVQYAGLNGVMTGTLQAYFVDDNKQLITVADGEGGCGTDTVPCPVGKNGGIPWTLGAKGIMVTNRAQTGSFFFKIFGWDKVGATASATAYMGVAADSSPELAIMPIGVPIDTNGVANLNPGQDYTLMEGDSRYDEGIWGYMDYNAYGGGGPVTTAWLDCGYKPALAAQNEWNQWCTYPGDSGKHAYGPTQYWTGADNPDNGPYFAPRLRWGVGDTGWWLAGNEQSMRDSCDVAKNLIENLNDTDVLIPMFDALTGSGNNATFHLLTVGWFHIQDAQVDCNVSDQSGSGHHAEWRIQGVFQQKVSAGSSGAHGDMRHSSLHVAFLEH
jgi:hypothetical protein